MDNWIDWNRGLGRMRRMVIDSLGLVGIAEADIPPEINFRRGDGYETVRVRIEMT